MSRFFSSKMRTLVPYTPGEQPQDKTYIKLNTNESPYPVSPRAIEEVLEQEKRIRLYPDPDMTVLRMLFAESFGTYPDRVVFSNGSDDLLNFAFMAFCEEENGVAFPDITYGFYPVYADLNHIPYTEIPVKDDFSVDPSDYIGIGKTIFLANPNAQTGCALSLDQIEAVIAGNPDNVVVVDEAYVDFGAETCVPLTDRYDNFLVIGTFSKSRSFAGGRLGYAIGNGELIRDMNTIRYSTNPYNINRYTMAAAIGILKDPLYMKKNCEMIMQTREWTAEQLRSLGFTMTDSRSNFLLAKSDRIDGKKLYLMLKEKGVLVRHFEKERIRDYNRITIGTKEQMLILIEKIKEILDPEEE